MNYPNRPDVTQGQWCSACSALISVYDVTESCQACGLPVHNECIDWRYYAPHTNNIFCDSCTREIEE